MHLRGLTVLLAAGLLGTACGGGEDKGATTAASTAASTVATVGSTSGATTSAAPTPDSTTVSDTNAAPDTRPDTSVALDTAVPAELWSATASAHLDAVLASIASPGTAAAVAETLFGLPVSVPLPDDAVLSGVYLDLTFDEFETPHVWWRVAFATEGDPAALEQAVVAGLADTRWEQGARVESTLDSGVFVTLNYPPTTAGEADGWELLGVTVGPETEGLTPTGRQEIEVSLTATPDEVSLPAFLHGWLDEMPVAPGLELSEFRATLTDLSTNGVWITADFHADPSSWADLVGYYAQDHSSGALVLEANQPPADLTTADRFSAGFFPTLAGYSLFATVSRDLAASSDPVTVELEVRVEPRQ